MDENEAYVSRIQASCDANEIKEIPIELIKHRGLSLKPAFFTIIQMWKSHQVPKKLKDEIIITCFHLFSSSNEWQYTWICIPPKHAFRRISNHVQAKTRMLLGTYVISPCNYSQNYSRQSRNWQWYDGGLFKLNRLHLNDPNTGDKSQNFNMLMKALPPVTQKNNSKSLWTTLLWPTILGGLQ